MFLRIELNVTGASNWIVGTAKVPMKNQSSLTAKPCVPTFFSRYHFTPFPTKVNHIIKIDYMNFVEQIITKLTGYKKISNFPLIDFFWHFKVHVPFAVALFLIRLVFPFLININQKVEICYMNFVE